MPNLLKVLLCLNLLSVENFDECIAITNEAHILLSLYFYWGNMTENTFIKILYKLSIENCAYIAGEKIVKRLEKGTKLGDFFIVVMGISNTLLSVCKNYEHII